MFFGGGQGERKAAARAIINAGYRGSGAYRRMYKGEAQVVPCFGALMMAGLGKIQTNGALEATLQRCHRVVMQKAAPGFRPPRWDRQAQDAAQIISERMTLWASQNLDDLGTHVPDVRTTCRRVRPSSGSLCSRSLTSWAATGGTRTAGMRGDDRQRRRAT